MKENYDDGRLWMGDCLELMKNIPDGSIDMVLCDLPYGTTACKWDTIIPFEPLWEQYWRIVKPNAAIVLTASQPFTTALISSQIKHFKYCWVWEKSRATGHVHSKNKPMKAHEDICVFSKGTTVHASQSKTRMPYNPQGLYAPEKPRVRLGRWQAGSSLGERSVKPDRMVDVSGYPKSIIEFGSVNHPIHPTQKPVALFEYLIKTYTNPGEIVLDNCAGSGTTAIASRNTNRRWLCIEKDEKYFEASRQRIDSHVQLDV